MKLYTEVWLPRAEEGGIGIEKVAAGGRPLQTTLNDKKQAMIHERIVELITSRSAARLHHAGPDQDRRAVPPRRRDAADSSGSAPARSWTASIRSSGFTRLMTSGVIRKAIGRGVQDGHFGYVSGPKPGL